MDEKNFINYNPIYVELLSLPFFENYEAFRLAPSQFPDGEGEKSGAQFWVNPSRQTASATEQ